MDNTVRFKVCTALGCSPLNEVDALRWDKLHDSLALVRATLELEDKLGVRFTADELASDEFRTIGGLVTIVERRLK